ncbi:MAG: Crp/Fnr family transcriptional regulator [Spirochaetales bacterium]|nr:Crp/Fnr family transcriptional regulator [Spirochaetales bacterium]
MSDPTLFKNFGLQVPKGETIFKENEEGSKMYIIQEGKVRISKNIHGKEHELAVLIKGEFFGEMAIVTQEKRTASASALEDTSLLSFDREGFASMINKNAKIALNIIEKLCRRLQAANQQIKAMAPRNLKGMIALSLYYDFKNADGKMVSYSKSLEEISLNLQLPLQDIKDQVEGMIKSGILKLENDQLILLNSPGLDDIADDVVKR